MRAISLTIRQGCELMEMWGESRDEAGAVDRSQMMRHLVEHVQDLRLYPKSNTKRFKQ